MGEMPDAAADIVNMLNENRSTDKSFFLKSWEGEVCKKKWNLDKLQWNLKKECSDKIKSAISSDKISKYRKYLCNLKLEKDYGFFCFFICEKKM